MMIKNIYFPMVLYSEASPELKIVYDDIMSHFKLNFVLNYFKVQGNNLTLLRGNWEKIKSVLFNGTIPRLVKEEIIYRISKKQGCHYCSYVHSRVIEGLQVQIKKLQGLEVKNRLSEDQKTAVELITIMTCKPAATTRYYFDRLVSLGFDSEQIPELMAVADLAILLNKQADIYGIEVDKEIIKLPEHNHYRPLLTQTAGL